MNKIHLNTVWPATVGFDRFIHNVEQLLNQAEASTSFPPHNIIKVDDNQYLIELAVAGFNKNDITIKTIDGILEIKGEKSADDKSIQYLHKGIGTRSFVKKLQLAETIEVRGAQFQDGILTIGLVNVVPDHKKPKVIEITSDIPMFNKKELLLED
jgi:molecular chaperone IbpA